MKSFKLLMVSLLCVLTVGLCACGNDKPVSKTNFLLDTICQIDIYDMDEDQAMELIDNTYKICSDYEKLLSKTIKSSEIYKVNHNKGKATKLSDDTIFLIKKGIEYGNLSKGKFDITVGKATDLWNFYEDTPRIPGDDELKEAVATIDYKNIVVDGNMVSMKNPDTEIDLGAVAKGFICDKASEYLIDQGVEHAVVNLGGNIATIGNKPNGDKFKIAIENPENDEATIIGTIEGDNTTCSTSGTYKRFFEVDGVRYHHILDVNTGYPCNSGVQLVTIISKVGNSVNCDCLSTVCLTYGVEEGLKLIESIDGVEAVFMDTEGNISCTSGAGFTPLEQ
ncbi:MAG: FAD:protein FMN transferase [Clostridia bacterium]|nr:FAD:protein FMN transferase [Clostridia bacterium]